MIASTSRCRGFTDPVVLVIRSSLQPVAQRAVPTSSRSPHSHLKCDAHFLIPGRRYATTGETASSRRTQQLARTDLPLRAQQPQQPAREGVDTGHAWALAQHKDGVTVYKSGPQGPIVFSSYFFGLGTLVAAGFNTLFNVYMVPPGVGAWVPVCFGAVGFVLAGFSFNFILKPANVVRSIKVLPSSTAEQVLVEVVTNGQIPGLPLKKMVVKPGDIVLGSRTYTPKVLLTPQQRLTGKHEAEEHRKGARPGTMASFRRSLTGEGFSRIEIKGYNYKLDVASGYALDNGRALDRLARIEQNPRMAQTTTQRR